MNTKLTIKNFRVFDENGVTIDIKPLTILTGCNSSGKSSVVKGISLLSQFVQNIIDAKNDGRPIRLSDYKLDFTIAPNNLLGNFEQIVNKKAKDKNVTFAYTIYSSTLSENIEIELTFGLLECDYLCNGYLQNLIIRNSKNDILYSSNHGGTTINYIMLKNGFKSWYKNQQKKNEVKIERFSEDKIANGIIGHDLIAYIPLFEELDKIKKTEIPNYLFERLARNRENRLAELENFVLPEYEGLRSLLESKAKKAGRKDASYLSDKELVEIYIVSSYDKKKMELGSVIDMFEASEYLLFSDFVRSIEDEDLSSVFTRKEVVIASSNDLNLECGVWDNNYGKILEAIKSVLSEDEEKNYCINMNMKGAEILHTNYRPLILFNRYVSDIITEIVSDETMQAIKYISSDLVNIKRLYSLDSKDDFTNLLKQYLSVRNLNNKDRIGDKLVYCDYPFDSRMGEFGNKWLNELGVGYRLQVISVEEGLGAQLRIYENEDDTNGRLLADYGYGITQLIALLLSIEVHRGQTIAIEEPEIHLHPSYQSKLAEMFADAYKMWGTHFIIETHSEYLIRKMQTLVLTNSDYFVDPDIISVLYINDSDVNNREFGEPQVKQIAICPNGYLDDNFGPGFYDEAMKSIKKLQQ